MSGKVVVYFVIAVVVTYVGWESFFSAPTQGRGNTFGSAVHESSLRSPKVRSRRQAETAEETPEIEDGNVTEVSTTGRDDAKPEGTESSIETDKEVEEDVEVSTKAGEYFTEGTSGHVGDLLDATETKTEISGFSSGLAEEARDELGDTDIGVETDTASPDSGTETEVGTTGGSETEVGTTGGSETEVGTTGGSETEVGTTGGSETEGGTAGGSETEVGTTGGSQTDVGTTGGSQTDGGTTGGSQTDGGTTGGSQTDVDTTGGSQTDVGTTGGSQTDVGTTGGSETEVGTTGGSETEDGTTAEGSETTDITGSSPNPNPEIGSPGGTNPEVTGGGTDNSGGEGGQGIDLTGSGPAEGGPIDEVPGGDLDLGLGGGTTDSTNNSSNIPGSGGGVSAGNKPQGPVNGKGGSITGPKVPNGGVKVGGKGNGKQSGNKGVKPNNQNKTKRNKVPIVPGAIGQTALDSRVIIDKNGVKRRLTRFRPMTRRRRRWNPRWNMQRRSAATPLRIKVIQRKLPAPAGGGKARPRVKLTRRNNRLRNARWGLNSMFGANQKRKNRVGLFSIGLRGLGALKGRNKRAKRLFTTAKNNKVIPIPQGGLRLYKNAGVALNKRVGIKPAAIRKRNYTTTSAKTSNKKVTKQSIKTTSHTFNKNE